MEDIDTDHLVNVFCAATADKPGSLKTEDLGESPSKHEQSPQPPPAVVLDTKVNRFSAEFLNFDIDTR